MRTRRFGPLDVEVPVIGIGTWNLELVLDASTVARLDAAFPLRPWRGLPTI